MKRTQFWKNLLKFLALMGPGIITANVDNDAGGLATYSQAGAAFDLDLLWIFIPVMIALIMVQEMVNRMGVVTGEGLSSLIRERFGVKITFYLMLVLFATNFGNVMAEFAGIAAAAEMFGVPAWLAVPLCALLVWILVLKWNYRSVEKVFLIACLFYFAYIVTCIQIEPDWAEIGHALVTPAWSMDSAYLLMMIGLVGTTIAPWMQFYQQAAVVEKKIDVEDYAFSKADTIVGGVVVSLVAAAIVIVCALKLHRAGVTEVVEASDAARSLGPLAGDWARHLFAFGLWNASMFAACILPLSTSYTMCEAMGWERGMDNDYENAPHFYTLYTVTILAGAAIIMIPGIDLIGVMLMSQVVNGFLLPVVLFFMLRLINDKAIMGRYANGRTYNLICWVLAALLSGLSLFYAGSLLFG